MKDADLNDSRATSQLALSRRTLLGYSSAMLVGCVPGSQLNAEPAILDQGPHASFMAVSALLIDHHLDPVIGGRIADEMAAYQQPLSTQIDRLIKLAQSKNALRAEDFFPFADDAAKAAALRIISAWYLGVVDNVIGSTVIAYELALMFQPTADVMTIPTYSINGPNGWGSKAPPLEAMPIF